jgi:hypothetical protein
MRFLVGFDEFLHTGPITAHRLKSVLLLLPALLLAACGQQGSQYGAVPYGGVGESLSFAPSHYYPPPGPPEDPWGPYIREAAQRYAVPEQWVRAVMHQESDGQEQAVSPVGAMGLMQVMPDTYEGLRMRYGLGGDPYDPHNNILAGTAYIREMYDRFGAPGFLAAYNAGPNRVDSYLAGAAVLPDETVNYLAAITPNLGNSVPLSGPLAMYASARPSGTIGVTPGNLAAGCDLNAAYDPNHPCTSLIAAATAPAPVQQAFVQQAALPQTGTGGCDLSAAYDPNHPCSSVGQPVAVAAAAPAPLPPAAPPVQQALVQAPVQPALAQQASLPQTGSGGCELSAAYDPNHPCTSAGQTVAMAAAAPAPLPPSVPAQRAFVQQASLPQISAPQTEAAPRLQLASAEGCDPNAAYDPDRPCEAAAAGNALPPVTAPPSFAAASTAGWRPAPPQHPSWSRPVAAAAPFGAGSYLLALPQRDWAIQIGAFANPALARAVAEGARSQAPGQLRAATLTLPPTPNGASVLYRARLAHLSASAAADACWQLNQRQLPCVVVQPSRS